MSRGQIKAFLAETVGNIARVIRDGAIDLRVHGLAAHGRAPRSWRALLQGETLPAPYKVGYGRPPVEHRFRRGQPGNPRGRPRGASNKPKIDTGMGMRGAEALLREEAYRIVTLREGDKVIEQPAIRAVFRAMGVAAMKGNRFAQRTIAEMITKVEQEDFASRLDAFGIWVEYKREWGAAIERAQRAGIEPPCPIPHPDDVILDPHTGGVSFTGPLTKEARDRLDEALARRAEAQENVNYFAEKYRKVRSKELKARYLEEWHFEQRMFDIINDAVPSVIRRSSRADHTAREPLARARRWTKSGRAGSFAASTRGDCFAP